MLIAGATNVAELVLARDEGGYGGTGFALLVTAFGCGMLAGSLTRLAMSCRSLCWPWAC